jgi:hypothetical protein
MAYASFQRVASVCRLWGTSLQIMLLAAAVLSVIPFAWSQTASTGAVRAIVTDPSGAFVVGAHVKVTVLATGETRQVDSGRDGSAVVSLLPPGNIRLDIVKDGFKSVTVADVAINVTETRTLPVSLTVGEVYTETTVSAQIEALHTEGTALGDVVTSAQVISLPLVTRNFTQVIALNAGVTSDVTNAAQAGRGSGGNPSNSDTGGNTYAHGDRGYDNDFEMNGLQVNDLYGGVGGIPIPNPDTIQEFKVQTAQYDAAFGRTSGANVDIITKGGSNDFHGTIFEFFRNTDLDANDYFSKMTSSERPKLDQNQFGGSIGGPIIKNKLFFFGSYQGTRQINAVGSVHTVSSPLFTSDRSAAALGAIFAGQRGYFQDMFGGVGPAIAADGSNINPAALAILQAKLPNGEYIVPTPQSTVNGTGLSTYAPSTYFNENQYMGNADYQLNTAQRLGLRVFTIESNETMPIVFGNIPDGYGQTDHNQFIVASLEHDWILTPHLLNEFRFGYDTTTDHTLQNSPYSFSDFGISVPAQSNSTPSFDITGSDQFGGTEHQDQSQNIFAADETVAWTKGAHTIRLGIGASKGTMDFGDFAYGSELVFESWPDFLLGLDAKGSGTSHIAPLGNVIAAVNLGGDFDRAVRLWQAYGYGQDDYRIRKNLTLNVGMRFDWLPPETDASGRLSNLDLDRMNPNPPTTGTLAGVIVSSNFPGTVPTGVTQTGGGYVIGGNSDGVFGPRIGFSWQPFAHSSTVVRGGYGVYYSRISGEVQGYASTSQPFGNLAVVSGTNAGSSTLQNPFPAGTIPLTYPTFTPYTPSTLESAVAMQNGVRPAIIQQLSLGVQQELPKHFVLELTSVNSRGTHLLRTLRVNQAVLASATHPIRGETTNTVTNVQQRVPYEGYTVTGLQQIQSEGASWYDDLEATLRKQLTHGMTFQVAYTFSKTLDSDALNASATGYGTGGYGNVVGNNTRYGIANFSRPQRIVASYAYFLPFFHEANGLRRLALEGWGVSGVTAIQAGYSLTLLGTNDNSAYGANTDYAQLGTGCTPRMEGKGGSVQSKIGTAYGSSSYFNDSCLFTDGSPVPYPIIGDDGVATGWGNSGISPVRGPGQNNYDISILKRTRLPLKPFSNAEFRADLFNALNTPQFADPGTTTSDPLFGTISSTSVAPRIVQFALKLNF